MDELLDETGLAHPAPPADEQGAAALSGSSTVDHPLEQAIQRSQLTGASNKSIHAPSIHPFLVVPSLVQPKMRAYKRSCQWAYFGFEGVAEVRAGDGGAGVFQDGG